MILYTVEEYKKLVEIGPPYNFISDISTMIAIRRYENEEQIKEFLIEHYPQVSKFLFEVPLRQVPLLMNSPEKLIQAIMSWRLSIGK